MKKENTILRERLSVYGEPFHAELRKERTANNDIIYHMYKVYDFEQPVFEEQIGCWSADNFDDAFVHFEKYCGLKYTEHYKNFMREYDKKIYNMLIQKANKYGTKSICSSRDIQ